MSEKKLTSGERMLMMAIKPFMPQMKSYLAGLSESLVAYVESVPLQENETHIAFFTDITDGVMYVVTGAFSDKTFVRVIAAEPVGDWIFSLIKNAKNGNAD